MNGRMMSDNSTRYLAGWEKRRNQRKESPKERHLPGERTPVDAVSASNVGEVEIEAPQFDRFSGRIEIGE
jgi:hypothetical protein